VTIGLLGGDAHGPRSLAKIVMSPITKPEAHWFPIEDDDAGHAATRTRFHYSSTFAVSESEPGYCSCDAAIIELDNDL
jgi:hypothetical protein